MKKCLILLTLLFLCACSSGEENKVCSYNHEDENIVYSINYEDGKVNSIDISIVETLDKETIKEIGEEKIDDYVKSSFKSLERVGVSVDASYDASKNEVNIEEKVNLNELSSKAYSKYYLDSKRKIKTLINQLKKKGFKCK